MQGAEYKNLSYLLILGRTAQSAQAAALFRKNRSPKNARTIHFMFGGRFGVSQTGLEDGLRGDSLDFLTNRGTPANRKKGFYTSRLPHSEVMRGIFVR